MNLAFVSLTSFNLSLYFFSAAAPLDFFVGSMFESGFLKIKFPAILV